jgi:RNA polymerase-binding transcription factor DksA
MADDIDRTSERLEQEAALQEQGRLRAYQETQQRAQLFMDPATAPQIFCIDCDVEIPRERLIRVPDTVRCFECQSGYEAELRRYS